MALRTPEVAVEDPYAGLSDKDLAARFDRGESETLNALCRRHYSRVFRRAYRLTQNLPEAEDCTQEAFTRFIRSWARWQDRSRGAGPWLATIVKNVARDRWQEQFKTAKPEDLLAFAQIGNPVAGESPDSTALERESRTVVATALQAMELPCRELIELLFQKGMTQKEAAEQLGDSHEAVKKRYQRCLKRLQATLAEWGVS
jgi:RNA polymerase sigma factor (sigma-70 family)